MAADGFLIPHKKMKPLPRILVAVASLSMLVLLFVPIWRIDLRAPQYPEGLVMQIHIDHFEGDTEKINGLNHYIGMSTIHDEMFPEFTYLPKVVIALVIFGVLIAIWGKRPGLFAGLFALVAFGLWAMYDMWKWGYRYGHELDPRAAIKVEGMVYQPPLIGHKTLLNFDAWSTPDIGGWVLFGVTGLFALLSFLEIREMRRIKKAKA